MKDLIAYIKVCVEFFTRIPVKRSKEESTISLNEAAIAFPIIGLFIGALIGLIWLIASYFLPTIVAAGIAIIGGIMLTGALHEDGISDCADGLGGHVSTKRALEIMRDSNIGTYGAVALIATIGFRWTGLANFSMWHGFVALIIAHIAGRTAILIPLTYSQYAREKGVASSVAKGVDNQTFWIAIAIAVCLVFLIGAWQGLLAFAFATLLAVFAMKWFEKKINGYTGDGLGAIEQISEISALLTFLALLT